jgi:thiamine biosynthesis lipoprotein
MVTVGFFLGGVAIAQENGLRTFDFITMTTEAHLTVPVTGPKTPDELFALAKEAIVAVEKLMAPIGEESDVARFNQSRPRSWTEINPLTLKVLEECAAGYDYSGEAFDPTIGGLKGLFRFDTSELIVWPSEEEINRARQAVGFDELTIDSQGLRIFKPKEGLTLDLGAAAKGFAIDRALEALREAGVTSALVEIGGEVGTLGLTPEGQPWLVLIDDPRIGGERLAFELVNSFVATSGGKASYFTYDGHKYLHILDPRTGTPISGAILQTTVAHPSSCLAADVMSTALFVVGPEGAKAALEAYVQGARAREVAFTGLEAIIFYQTPDDKVRLRLYRVSADGSVIEVEAASDIRLLGDKK